MAQMLEVSCTQCGEQEIQLDGPIVSGARPRSSSAATVGWCPGSVQQAVRPGLD